MKKLHIKVRLNYDLERKRTAEVTKRCCQEIAMVVRNLKRVASATVKSEKVKKSTAPTEQRI
jgi:hypothetical protein